MNLDQRQTFRIEIPEGREQAALVVGKQQVEARILDESAAGFAVVVPADVDLEQNKIHVLKTATGSFETRVARVEHFSNGKSDGKLVGLMRLQDQSDTKELVPKAASWRDNLFVPPPPPSVVDGRSVAAGISVTVVAGVLVCVLALHYMRSSTAQPSPGTSPLAHDVTQTITQEVVKAREAPREAEKPGGERQKETGDPLAKTGRGGLPSPESIQFARLQARLSPEVLYRLQLSSDQSRRIRNILNRSSSDLAAAEAGIREVLTEEQDRQWQSLVP